MSLLTLQNDAFTLLFFLLLTALHCDQAKGEYVAHAESLLGVGKARLKAEI